ncbi:MAG: IS200/IS605 family accessory protein TnpB-related protein [Promethearchaeati archaeon SRVP18_Atabeyarchaeia-1]
MSSSMRAVKAVQVPYEPTSDVLSLLETFRSMVNCCIRVGLEKNVTSRFSLQSETYHKLGNYGLHTWYSLSAIEAATAILKNYRKAKRRRQNARVPRATKLIAKLGNQGYKVADGKLRIPIKPREYFYVPLHKRAAQFLSDATLKLGSITLTSCAVSVVFSKIAEVAELGSYVAYDTNERSIDGAYVREDGGLAVESRDLSGVSEARQGYFERVRRMQARYAKDRRVATKIQRRWFANQNSKVSTMLHQVSSAIVRQAKTRGQGIILEDLRHIRRTINRKVLGVNDFNRKIQMISIRSKRLKRRLNSWSFRRLQGFIEYKALWDGAKITKVSAWDTSRVCAVCGCVMRDPKAKTVECCGMDRHVNACLSMLKAQDERVRFTLDRSARVAVISPFNKAMSQSGEVNPNGYQSQR